MRLVAADQAEPRTAVPVSIPAFTAPLSRPREGRILGVDIENGPDWYGGGDFVYDRIFCVSHKWVGSSDDEVYTTWIDWTAADVEIERTLRPLWRAVTSADVFLGHNFRHDWKGLVGLFRDVPGYPPLDRKPVVDTMRCIPAGIPRGLENLCARFDLGEKPHLSAHDWTLALRRGDPKKIELVKHRNRTDVILTERLYHKERELGWITT